VAAFPPLALGKGMEGWSGERWVDVRSPDIRAVARTVSRGILGSTLAPAIPKTTTNKQVCVQAGVRMCV
jgi:hypothetical protein